MIYSKEQRDRASANGDHSVAASLVCGRAPAQAHHIRYAQDRGLGLKVSDEFVVPICAIDLDALHRSGNERAWWHDKQIDPLPHAEALWRQRGTDVATTTPSSANGHLA